MVNSIHVARWISQFDPTKYEFILIPSTPTRKSHPLIRELAKKHGHVTVSPANGIFSQFLWLADLFLKNRVRMHLMRHAIRKYKPDLVHALEFQHGAYLAELALRKFGTEIPFLATCYGSDIFWFQRYPGHARKIARVLGRADAYSAECERDVALAKAHGFKGLVLPVIPNAGGLNLRDLPSCQPISERKSILVKGYDSWVGRGSLAIEALGSIAEELEDYKVNVYSAEWRTRRAVRRLPKGLRSRTQIWKKGKLSHNRMIELFGEAKIYLGVSESDGISTSLLESLAMGCMPVQTNTACTAEWFVDGVGGFEIHEINRGSVAAAVKSALFKAENLPAAIWEKNLQSARSRLDGAKVGAVAQTFYDLTLSQRSQPKNP